MKKYRIYTALVTIVSSALLAGCSLQEDKESFVSPDQFYKSEEECYAGLNSCYIPLKSIYTYPYMIATEGVTDLMWIASGTQDAQLDISPANPRCGSTVWVQSYIGVRNANSCVAGIENSGLSDDVKKPLLGEAKIMRAYYYYLLTCFFGDVPFYRTNVTSVEILQKIQKLPRMSADSTRASLIAELQECVPDMDQKRTSDVKDNRSGAAMGWMLIAKMAMWNKEWNTALDALKHLESIYGDLSDYPLEDIKFCNKNTPESIFEIQHTYTPGGLSYTSNVACITMPRPRTSNTSIYDGVEVDLLGDQTTVWMPLRPNVYFCQGLMTKMSKDLRKDMTMVWDWEGHPFNNVNTRPWMGPKFWCPGMNGSQDSNNYKVFRYADAILMMSECYCELQDAENSMKYLNMVKARAGIDQYTKFKTFVRLTDEIRKERARELIGEFQRKFDLVRWGTWYQETYDNTDYAALKDNLLPCKEYYPIPDVQVVYSGYALDNKAYAAYGY